MPDYSSVDRRPAHRCPDEADDRAAHASGCRRTAFDRLGPGL